MDTKACNLTEYEIEILITVNGNKLYNTKDRSDIIERINYLNKRLKEFSKAAKAIEPKPENKSVSAQSADAQIKGWT